MKKRAVTGAAGAETAPCSSRADVREQATNGSEKAVPQGTFDRPLARSIRGLGYSPTSSSGTEKDIPMTCLPVLGVKYL